MANQWGSTSANEWGISGSSMQVSVNFESPTESTNPLILVTLRDTSYPIPPFSTLDVVGMSQAGFIARIQTTDGSELTQEMVTNANLHIDWLAHDD